MSLSKNQSKIVVDFQMYLMALIQSLLELGYDPRNSFDVIIRTIELLPEEYVQTELLDFNLISMSKIVHIIPPFYLNDALRVVKVSKNRISFLELIFSYFLKLICSCCSRCCQRRVKQRIISF